MHIGNSDPEVGPPVRRWSERGVVLYRGHPAKSRDAEAESLLGRRRALFCCAEAPKQTVCRLRRYGDPVRPVGRMHKAAGIWRSAPFLCAFTPHEFFCPEGLGKRQNTGRPLPCRVLRALSSAECEKAPGPNGPGASASILLVVHRGHVADQIHHLVGVTALVVVPGNHLHEGVGQSNTGLGIEDRGAGIAQEVGGDHVLVGVAQNALSSFSEAFFMAAQMSA